MAEAAVAEERPERRRFRLRTDWVHRLMTEFAVLFAGLFVLAAVGLVLLDTAPGHRFIADRIGQIETQSGLRFRIGRIEGSIFDEARLKNVEILDQHGTFLTSPEIELDWAPAAWLYNALHIDRLYAERVTLMRLPELKETEGDGPILPRFDIHVGELEIEQLELLAPVTGRERSGSVRGRADVRSGIAVVDLGVELDDGGDRMRILLDAEPDRDRFDLEARVLSPADGLVPALVGIRRSLDLTITGDGSWGNWLGSARLDLSGRSTARLRLTAQDGRYGVSGAISPSQFLGGPLQSLTAPTVRVLGSGTLSENILDGEITFGSNALRAVASGAIDLSTSRFQRVRLGVDLLRPPALFPNMRGRNVRMLGTLDGAFRTARFSYRLTSPELYFDNTGFIDVRAQGQGRLSDWPMRVPLQLSARAITGIGEVAGAILANARLEGMLIVTPTHIRGERLQLSSDRVRGTVSLLLDLATGRFEVLLAGGMTRYMIEGLGIVDVQTDLSIVPGPGGVGTRVVGKATAWVRRLDNSFFASLTGGLPRIETDLERGSDGIIRFSNLQLYSPDLRLSGQGRRNRDGTFHIEARGRQAEYGPVRLTLDGNIARPRVELLLERPNETLDLSDVRLSLLPTASGFDYSAAGQSLLGAFTSDGRILLPAGGRAVISIADLAVGGTRASGDLRSDPGGFTGILNVAGGGLDGSLAFDPVDGAQRIKAHLTASNVRFPDAFSVRSGRLDGTIILAEGRTSLDGVINARGLEAAGVTLARLTANGRLVNGSGQVRAVMAGRRGAAFEFNALANVSPDRIELTGRGSVERRPLVLNQAAVLTRSGDGWALAPTRVTFAGGRAILSGRSGSQPEVHAELQSMPMRILNIAWPGLGLNGEVSGRLDYAWQGGRSGSADLRIRNLSRSGLVLASQPIDLGLKAAVNGNRAALRAVAVSNGETVGRAQARFAPLGGGPLIAELLSAPLFAQLRYAGPADALWRLSGTELFDLTGQVAIGADIGGNLIDPVIRGSVRTANARLESAVTGTLIEQVAAEARFNGSRLVFSRLSGRTNGRGAIEGSGTVDLSGGSPDLDLQFNARNALLLNRDDIAARVTGPLRVRSTAGGGGVISGDLHLDSGRFTLGQAAAAAAVPQLDVTHRGLPEEEIIETEELRPWRLDMQLAGGDLQATGLGIDSSWNTNLRIGGTAAAPTMTGRADLVRGEYEFAGRNFRLDHGVIRFRGQSPPNPLLDIRAEARVQGLDASVRVTGTGNRPEISFASVPALPQDELLSRLLFGTSITNLSAAEALQLASAVAALQSGEGGLDPINSIREAIGLDRLRILPADIATGQGTAIAAGKYLGRSLFVEVITDGQGYSATRTEYQVTRWLSLLSSISTIGRTSANVRISRDY